MKILAIVVLLFVFGGTTNAQTSRAVPPKSDSFNFKSGNDLLHDCEQPEMSSAGVCIGYILGALDMINTEQDSSRAEEHLSKDGDVCLPPTIDGWKVSHEVSLNDLSFVSGMRLAPL